MAPFTPKVKKLLTRPVLKLEEGKPRYVKIEEPMFIGKAIRDKKEKDEEKKKDKEPATIINVINLEDGSLAQIVANTVLKSVLTDEYPPPNKQEPIGPENVPAYVGKCFAITKQGRAPGKQYNPFHIEEIEDPTAQAEQETTGNERTLHAAAGKRR